jgi:TRAP-type transport system small permease protein
MSRVRFLVDYFEEIITSILLVEMVFSVFVGVVWRYVLNNPLIWTEELARIASTWFIFLGGAICFKRSAHISIDVLVRMVPPPVQRGIKLVASGLVMLVLAVIIVQGIQYTSRSFVLVTTALQIPMGYWNAAVPAGSALMLIRLVQAVVASLRGPATIGGL